jgi:hypothetical protein
MAGAGGDRHADAGHRVGKPLARLSPQGHQVSRQPWKTHRWRPLEGRQPGNRDGPARCRVDDRGRAGYLGGAGGMAMAQRAPPAAQHEGPATLMVCCWQSSRSEVAVSSRSALGRRWRSTGRCRPSRFGAHRRFADDYVLAHEARQRARADASFAPARHHRHHGLPHRSARRALWRCEACSAEVYSYAAASALAITLGPGSNALASGTLFSCYVIRGSPALATGLGDCNG